jgi:hypothetical protein
MPSIKIDKSEQVSIKAGIHSAIIDDAAEAVSNAGNEMLKLKVKVGSLTFNSWVVFTTKNSRNVAEFATSIGKKVVEGKTLTIETEDCIGKTATVELGEGERINEKTGKPYLEIKRWLPPGSESTDTTGDEIPF